MEVEQKDLERTSCTLVIRSEVYNDLTNNIRSALSVAGSIKGIIPPYLAERLEGCLAKALGALGQIDIHHGSRS